jgi:hypothetical protein
MRAKNRVLCTSMCSPLSRVTDQELLASLSNAVGVERKAMAEVIARLAEVDRRRLYLAEACSSLHAFCVQRLGYSENEAQKRIHVARLYQRLPQVLDELENGTIHLTGLFVLAGHLTESNADALLAEARRKTRREIDAILARWFPQPDVLTSITPLSRPANDISPAIPGNGTSSTTAGSAATLLPATVPRPRLEPLSAKSYRVEFTASATLHDKIEQARNMLGHALPNGDLAQLFERALDALLAAETKRRLGAAKPRRQRALKPGSRHVPVEVARAVWQRDGSQCTFTDAEGRRCTERRYLELEHREPFARGGPASVDNLCLLCAPHNALRAREEFGEAHVEAKRREAQAREKTSSALVGLGFERRKAREALEAVRGTEAEVEGLLRGALGVLVM